MQKFVAGQWNGSEFVNQILYQIIADRIESWDLEKDYQKQQTIELNSKNFQFSRILLNLELPLEAFDNDPNEDDSDYLTEDELREIVQRALIEIEKYFIN